MQTSLHAVICPYCGETFDAVVDESESYSEYIEDCYVCCRPITFVISTDLDGDIAVMVRHENDC